MPTVSTSELQGLVGSEIGVSNWIEVGQERINQFADVTEDHQFIHVNPEAAKMTPFGGTIAHGFLSLSLLSQFAEQSAITLENVAMGVNYGFEKIRFLSPVPVDSKVRGRFVLKDVVEKNPGQFLMTYAVAVEIDGIEKPALIADWLVMQMVK